MEKIIPVGFCIFFAWFADTDLVENFKPKEIDFQWSGSHEFFFRDNTYFSWGCNDSHSILC